jgi:hypothetical protein
MWQADDNPLWKHFYGLRQLVCRDDRHAMHAARVDTNKITWASPRSASRFDPLGRTISFQFSE